jgi:hypothetical protein
MGSGEIFLVAIKEKMLCPLSLCVIPNSVLISITEAYHFIYLMINERLLFLPVLLKSSDATSTSELASISLTAAL